MEAATADGASYQRERRRDGEPYVKQTSSTKCSRTSGYVIRQEPPTKTERWGNCLLRVREARTVVSTLLRENATHVGTRTLYATMKRTQKCPVLANGIRQANDMGSGRQHVMAKPNEVRAELTTAMKEAMKAKRR